MVHSGYHSWNGENMVKNYVRHEDLSPKGSDEEHKLIVVPSVQFSCSFVSDSLWLHGLQHTRLPCPSLTPRAYPNSCPLSRWCHPTISSSVIPFSSCPRSFPASVSFQMSQFFTSGGQSIEVSASTSVLPMNTQDWSLLGWTGWISSQSKGLSKVFSNTLSYPLLNEFSVLGDGVPLLCLISLHSTNSQCKLSRNPVLIPFTKICHDSYCFFSLLYIISYFLVSLMSNIFMVSTSGRGRYNNLFVSYAIFNHPFPGWISTLDSVFSWLYLMQENSMASVFRGFFFLLSSKLLTFPSLLFIFKQVGYFDLGTISLNSKLFQVIQSLFRLVLMLFCTWFSFLFLNLMHKN